MIEAASAYASTTVFYNVPKVRRAFGNETTSQTSVISYLKDALSTLKVPELSEKVIVEVPVSFAEADALDLPHVAAVNGISTDEVVRTFLRITYRVYMLGFLPGFCYMGTVDPIIATDRRSEPRRQVPAGSVGIAGSQTGIYSLPSPGGWQIIGRTDMNVFDPGRAGLSLLKPGDNVRFIDTA